MSPGRPGDDEPYPPDPYREDPYGRRANGRDPYGRDPYGVRGGAHEADAYGGRSHGETYGQSYESYETQGPYQESDWDTDPYAYERPRGDYQAAVDSLSDPLTDPLPASGAPESGSRGPSWAPEAPGAVQESGHREDRTSPWFRPAREQDRQPQSPHHPHPQQHPQAEQQNQQTQASPTWEHQPARSAAHRGPADVGETATLPAVESPAAGPVTDPPGDLDSAAPTPAESRTEDADDERSTVALRRPSAAELGGRAARRRAAAAKGRGGRRAAGSAPAAPPRAMTRLEARRAARAAKDGPVVLLSRAIGEVFITCGVLMLLFVTYQLWWTNILADNYAGGAKENLTQKWEQNPERRPGEFSPGQGFAIMYIPKLDVVVPVAQGIDKKSVLDNGLVGHYDKESGVPTAMPWDEKGNFGVAAHRNTHGEPFRYINRLIAGDEIVIETAEKYYVYEMYSRLPSTSPSNVSVLEPVPPQSGFDEPGRYITLTTCTPEFTSKYRLIVWGRMVDERPRSDGKPDALVE